MITQIPKIDFLTSQVNSQENTLPDMSGKTCFHDANDVFWRFQKKKCYTPSNWPRSHFSVHHSFSPNLSHFLKNRLPPCDKRQNTMHEWTRRRVLRQQCEIHERGRDLIKRPTSYISHTSSELLWITTCIIIQKIGYWKRHQAKMGM